MNFDVFESENPDIKRFNEIIQRSTFLTGILRTKKLSGWHILINRMINKDDNPINPNITILRDNNPSKELNRMVNKYDP